MSTSLLTWTLKAWPLPWVSGSSLVSIALRIKCKRPHVSFKVLNIGSQMISPKLLFLESLPYTFCSSQGNCFSMDTCAMVCTSLLLSALSGVQEPISSELHQLHHEALPNNSTWQWSLCKFPQPHLCVSPTAHITFYLLSYLFVYLLSPLLDCVLFE